MGKCVQFDREAVPGQHWPNVSSTCIPAIAFVNVLVEPAAAFLLAAVEVLGVRKPSLLNCQDKYLLQEIGIGRALESHGPVVTMVVTRTEDMRLGTFKIGEDVPIGPALTTSLTPHVIVPSVASHDDHEVVRRAAA